MKDFKLRASKGGVLLQTGKAGAGTKTYVKEWIVQEITGIKKRIDSKYLTSGIEREPFSIARIAKHLNEDIKKNEERFENDFFTGEPDIITSDTIIDAKSSWDAFTFPLFEDKPDAGYYRQLQIYMALTGKSKAKLIYCLENGTEDMINSLAWKIAKEQGSDEMEMEHWELAEKELNYDHLPDHLRIKVYSFDRDDEMIKNMEGAVVEMREYIKKELMPLINNMES